jgi:type VI protein secretion system component Hcp
MNRYRVAGALVGCAGIAAALALVAGAFGNGSAHAARAVQAASPAATLTIEGLEGATGLEVQSYSWGIENPTSIGTPGGGAGEGKVKLDDLTVARAADAVSPGFVRAAATGEHFPSATLEARVGKSALRYTFHLVFVTSVQHTGGANGVVENLSLTYGSLEVESIP